MANQIPEMRVGMHGDVWTVAVADRFGWTMAGTGDPLADITVNDWLPLVPAPAPKVYFPGDTVPARVRGANLYGVVCSYDTQDRVSGQTLVEVAVPMGEEWQATVDRAKAAHADSEWQHTRRSQPVSGLDQIRAAIAEADRNYQPLPEPEPGADRWVHLRNTCPHGVVRGLLTCPVCEPEAQAAAEASARAEHVADPGTGEA